MGLNPLLEQLGERSRATVQAGRSAGATALEVRRGLEQLRDEIAKAAGAAGVDDPALAQELAAFINREVAAYGQTAPRSSIFKNAARTSARYAPAPAAVETLKCPRCGAARAEEAVETCQFCGHDLRPGAAK